METAPDAARLRALFEQPGLHWILDRLVERMSRGRPLIGTIVHSKSTSEERRALDDLLGRPSTRGNRLTLDLAELEQTLRSAGIADQLEDAVVVSRGPVKNQREQTERRRDEWAKLFETSRARAAGQPALVEWVNALARDGTLKRLSHGDPGGAAILMEGALRVGMRNPREEVLLANLAAECAGDSHALDRGQPLATLCLRAVTALYGVDGQRGAEARRKAWLAAGVIIDDLSAPVLVFNLRAAAGSSLEQVLDFNSGVLLNLSIQRCVRSSFAKIRALSALPPGRSVHLVNRSSAPTGNLPPQRSFFYLNSDEQARNCIVTLTLIGLACESLTSLCASTTRSHGV